MTTIYDISSHAITNPCLSPDTIIWSELPVEKESDPKMSLSLTENDVQAGLSLLKMMGLSRKRNADVMSCVEDADWVNVRHKAMARQLTLQDLRRTFDKPICEAAFTFGICTTLLKKICRKIGVKRWPCRALRSLSKNIQTLESSLTKANTQEDEDRIYRQIVECKEKRNSIMMNPSQALLKNEKKNSKKQEKKEEGNETDGEHPESEEGMEGSFESMENCPLQKQEEKEEECVQDQSTHIVNEGVVSDSNDMKKGSGEGRNDDVYHASSTTEDMIEPIIICDNAFAVDEHTDP